MRSARPKPIHLLCGRAMTSYVLDALESAGVEAAVVVTGRDEGRVSKRLMEDPPAFPVTFAEQDINLGPADAALIGVGHFDDFDDEADLVVTPGDVPLLRPAAITRLIEAHRSTKAACTVLTAAADHPAFSNDEEPVTVEVIRRDKRGRVVGIEPLVATPGAPVPFIGEAADRSTGADDHDPSPVPEAALGVYCFRRELLAPVLRRCLAESLSARVPLREAVAVVAESGHDCRTVIIGDPTDALPVDNRLELAEAESELRRRTNRYWMSMGVTMVDPDHTYIDATVELGTDVTIFPDTILQGATVIGDGCELGPGTHLDRCRVGDNCRLEKTTASLAVVGDDCVIGPFAVLAPGTEVPAHTVTGPFWAGSDT